MSLPKVLVIGGAGAQNSAITTALSESGKFASVVLTRDTSSPHAEALTSLPNVTLALGDCFNEPSLVKTFQDVKPEYCFVNTNGFAVGEKEEIYWGIRIYELAAQYNVKHFIYGGLPYVSKNGGFRQSARVPFADAKGKVGAYLSAMPTAAMAWSNLESGPYAEVLWEGRLPTKDKDGVYVFTLPLGPTGAMPLVSLTDLGKLAVWMFLNPQESNGLTLGVAIDHITGPDHATAFTAATGKPARYQDVPLAAYMSHFPDLVIGKSGPDGWTDPIHWTAKQQFGPWWQIWRESGGNTGLWRRDYELLDRIFPDRIRTLEEWFRSVGYNGEGKKVLVSGLDS